MLSSTMLDSSVLVGGEHKLLKGVSIPLVNAYE